MMRALPLIPIVTLAGLPVLIHPTSGFAAVAAVAGSLCAAGALARWRPLVTAGGSLTLIQYTVALAGSRSRLVSAIVLGVSLALVLDVSEFSGRFHGAAITAPVLRRQARHWIASASLGALTATALAAVAAFVRISGPPALPPLLAAIGALAAAAGVAGAVWRRRQESG
jgi:hypothetical protein